MNRSFFILGIAALLPFAACQKTSTTDTSSSDSENAVAETISPSSKPVAAATQEPNLLAPPGVFFLLAATSVQTDDGIIGLPPGTRVLQQADGTFLAGVHRLTLRANQITNDLRVARRFSEADAAAQTALRRTPAATVAGATPRVSSATPTPARVARSLSAPATPARSASPPSSTSLGQTGGLGKAHSANKAKVYTDPSGHRYWKDALGRKHYDF